MGSWRAPRHVSRQFVRPEDSWSFYSALDLNGRTVDIRDAPGVWQPLAVMVAGPLRGLPRWRELAITSIHAGPAAAVRAALATMKTCP